ncbi:hypothetical protein Tco_0716353 [Tanacetum coccineum]
MAWQRERAAECHFGCRTTAMMTDASAFSVCSMSQPYRRLCLILVRLDTMVVLLRLRDRPILLNGNGDEYEWSITWLGYLFGSVRVVIVHILAGRTLRFAAMADASCLSLYSCNKPPGRSFGSAPDYRNDIVSHFYCTLALTFSNWLLLSKGDDDYERSINWLGCLFGMVIRMRLLNKYRIISVSCVMMVLEYLRVIGV